MISFTGTRFTVGAGIASLLICGILLAGGESGGIRITSYNVENYLTMPRHIDGKLRSNAGKPESERAAVVRMIDTIHPDLLGLMEIGEPRQLEDLKKRLRGAGLEIGRAHV